MKIKVTDRLYIVGSIASKDIVDSLRNRLVLSMILLLSIMLLMPKLMSLILVSPHSEIAIFDPGRSRLGTEMAESPEFRVKTADSIPELEEIIGSAGFGIGSEFGLAFPADLDKILESGDPVQIEGYVAWANRGKAAQLGSDTEERIAELLGQPGQIHIENNIIYPPPESGLLSGIMTISGISIILMVGITLVPGLLFDEKETKTLDALLVSPSTIWEVVIGKALAGLFYNLVAAGVIFVVYATGVVHWEIAILFTLGSGLFAVAVGLVLGSIFEGPQEVTGWTSALLVLFTASMFVRLLALDLPAWISSIVDWVPSVTLGQVFLYVFSDPVPTSEIWSKLGSVLILSTLLYAAVAWKLRRSDQ